MTAVDAAPAALASGTPARLRDDLIELLGADRVRHRAIDLIAYASDASAYRLIPQAVVLAQSADDVAAVFAYGREHGIGVTLRAGGTSLNGQAQGDGILVDVRRHFDSLAVLEDGAAVRLGCGTLLGKVNRALSSRQRRLGPDPASTDIATIGGVVANNSGGMRCGVTADPYSTLRSLTFVLPSGTVIDTAAPDAAVAFAAAEPELCAGLVAIRDEIRADTELSERVRRKFQIKNTTGYRLCAFLDADEPLEIFQRLIVGSEGTLAFVPEVVMHTVEHGHHTATGLILFEDVEAAAAPVHALVQAGATAVELMLTTTLIAASWSMDGMPEAWRELPQTGAVLLVELRSTDPDALDPMEAAALRELEGARLLEPASFTRDRHETEKFWRVREGLQGIVGYMRPAGTALMIEDICVPPARIADATRDLQALLTEHGFLPGVAGHASAGNLHFLLSPNLTDEADRDRYDGFMHALVELVVDKYDGSLKAEHGTGRNMAPYVEHEWGAAATELMWRIKALADPDGLLGRDCVLSRDPGIHLRDLKSTPEIEEVGRATKCIECGFCEPVCPSRALTLTPRQRIVVRRELARQPSASPLSAALLEQWDYDGEHTCAADGSCRLVCPLGIDTGALIKHLRTERQSPDAEARGLRAAQEWARVESAARAGLRAATLTARVVGDRPLRAASVALRARTGTVPVRALAELVPEWLEALPHAAPAQLPRTDRTAAAAVYLPACINRIFGPSRASRTRAYLPQALVAVSARAGMPLWIPDDVAGTCCAQPWDSKGLSKGRDHMATQAVLDIKRWTEDGKLPLVIDAASCAHALAIDGVRVLDAVAWAAELLPHLTITRKADSATVHPPCSSRQLGSSEQLIELVSALSDAVNVPLEATCCGMAGDRGMLHPELTASATRGEAAEVGAHQFTAHISANRTCEIALEQATGRPYASVIHLLEEATR